MALTVETLWVVYFSLFIGLSLILGYVGYRTNKSMVYMVLFASLIAGLVLIVLAFFYVDQTMMVDKDKQSLIVLMWMSFGIFLLFLILSVIFYKRVQSATQELHDATLVNMTCNEEKDECKITDVSVTKSNQKDVHVIKISKESDEASPDIAVEDSKEENNKSGGGGMNSPIGKIPFIYLV